jgi:AI-2 transport protein TqsA
VTPEPSTRFIVGSVPTSSGVDRVLPLWLSVVLGVAGSAVAIWGMHAAAPILGPVFLAFVLTVVVHPIIGMLVRRGVRKGFAIAIAVLVVEGVLLGFAIALFLSFGQLVNVLPEYSDEWQALLDDFRSTLAGFGIGREQVEAALHSLNPASVISELGGLFARLVGVFGALVLVVATVLFMTAEGAGLPQRLKGAPGAWRLQRAMGDFARNTRRYLVVTSIFGFLVAVVDAVALAALGVPLPLLWGLLSFLTNYVPNIGFFLGLAPPTLLATLVGGPALGLTVIAIYCLANFVLQSVVQPIFVGDAVGLSVTLSFLSVIVWTVILGPMGAVLAVPLTLFAHAILVGQDPERTWARILLAGTSDGAKPHRPSAGRGSARRRFAHLPSVHRRRVTTAGADGQAALASTAQAQTAQAPTAPASAAPASTAPASTAPDDQSERSSPVVLP